MSVYGERNTVTRSIASAPEEAALPFKNLYNIPCKWTGVLIHSIPAVLACSCPCR